MKHFSKFALINNCPPPPRLLNLWISAVAAALVAMAAPTWAQNTGTLQVTPGNGFSMTETATLVNHEWVINYSADIAQAFYGARGPCLDAFGRDAATSTCNLDPPYFVKYGEAPGGAFSCTMPPSGLSGHSMTLSGTSWSQTIRAHPNTSYCINVYKHNSGYFQNNLITAVWFRTPVDPNPPTPAPWMPHPSNTGCGTETTLALVRQCFQCKGGGGSWSMSANTCGN